MKKILIFVFTVLGITALFSVSLQSDRAVSFAEMLRAKGIDPYMIVAFLAMLPIFELRGSIPVGILVLKLDLAQVLIYSIIGNMIPIFFMLLFFSPVEKLLRKIRFFDKIFDWLFARTKAKSKSIEKYEEIGLMLFVGIPLPATGAWTGSLAAYIFKLSYFKSILFIFFGVLLACAIVTALTLFWKLGALVLGICIIVFIYIAIKGIIDSSKKVSN